MTRMPVRIAMLLAALAGAWQPSKARAADEDTQFWLTGIVRGNLDEDLILVIDTSLRVREPRIGPDQQTLRVTVEKEVADGVRIGGGAAIFETGGQTELRPHQQATFTTGRLELRTRLEERFFDDADRMELRFRQRVQYNQPIAPSWRGTAGVEWLALLRARNRGEGFSSDQWRFQASVSREIGKNLELGAIYWLVLKPRGERTDRISHIPQAAITYRF